jgi:hypothetical protein
MQTKFVDEGDVSTQSFTCPPNFFVVPSNPFRLLHFLPSQPNKLTPSFPMVHSLLHRHNVYISPAALNTTRREQQIVHAQTCTISRVRAVLAEDVSDRTCGMLLCCMFCIRASRTTDGLTLSFTCVRSQYEFDGRVFLRTLQPIPSLGNFVTISYTASVKQKFSNLSLDVSTICEVRTQYKCHKIDG